MADRFYRKFYVNGSMEIEMFEPLGIDNVSIQTHDILEGIVDEKIEMILESRSMGLFRPKNLFPPWVQQVPFSEGYELPEFIIYEGHGDPEKHIRRFLKQCGETA